MKNIILYVTVLAANTKCNDVDYYVDLITKETALAFTYPLPTDSSEFRVTSPGMIHYPSANHTFDYIIVGGGSAGAVVASRLSESRGNKVLLIEAGYYETDFSDIPRLLSTLQGLRFNWNFNTTPQENACLGMVNKQCPVPRGKGIGGTSIINALMYVRGNKEDYNKWEKNGNKGWSYDSVLPYFIKSENSSIRGDAGYHGSNGYLNVEFAKSPSSPQFDAFIEANLELGRKVIDYNGKEQLGVAETQFNIINGRRCSTRKAFLMPAKNRTNLKILTGTFVTKILISPIRKRATGVIFSRDGKLYQVNTRKEIIVCAGSIGSPQLLMLSGIGPRSHLKDLNIPVQKSLQVGYNYQDHATYFALNVVTNYTEPVQTLRENVKNFLKGTGSLVLPGNAKGLGFYQTKFANVSDYPDIELILIPSSNTSNFEQKAAHYNNETYNAIWKHIDPQRTFTLFVTLLHPQSRGRLKLKSSSYLDYPEIDPKFLSDAKGQDIATLYEGIQLALEIINTNAFKKLNASLMYAPLPACAHHEYLSKSYWYCQLRQLTFHIHHPVGTCKMGPKSDPKAVVDHQLKVYGIRNLRVADASIIPEAISGHTNAAAIMIGEKISDMIAKGRHCC